jgi:hypothetical protein
LTFNINGQPASADLEKSSLSGERQFWVCEIKGDEFAANSYVVTSPLSGVDAGGLLARAELAKNESENPAQSSRKKLPAADAIEMTKESEEPAKTLGDAS